MIIFYQQARLVDPDFALMKGEHQKLLNIVRVLTGTPQLLKEFQINFSDLVLKDCIKPYLSA